MPANVETAAYANRGAWHREGVTIDTNGEKGMRVEQALPAGGLDWGVDKTLTLGFATRFAKLNDPGQLALAIKAGMKIDLADLVVNEGRFNVQRDTDGKLLGNVGSIWDGLTPAQAFAIVDDLIAAAGGRSWIEALGALDGGKKIWIMVHLDSDLQIAGEKYATYLTIVTGFDGRTSTSVFVHDERIVCSNTLAIGLGEGKETGRIVNVRHTVKAKDRLAQAHGILKIRSKRHEELAKQGEWLVDQTMSDADFAAFMDSLMPVPELPAGKTAAPNVTMAENRRALVSGTYYGAENLAPIRGTRWGALQAVIEYADHKRPFKDDESQLKAQFGFTAQQTAIKDRAFTILRDPKLAPVA